MQQTSIELLTFEIDRQRFGIAVADVREITRAVAFARIPKTPRIVEGVINFRGTAIPVLDIRSRFDLPQKAVELADHLIVARAKSRTVCIRVDRVVDLLIVPSDDIEDVEAVTPNSDYIVGVAKLPGNILLIHDLAMFLSDAEAEELNALEEPLLP